MKKLLFLLVLMIFSCGSYNPSNPNNISYTTADKYDFRKFDGKTIKSIRYFENAGTITGCDDLIIWFKDGTRIRCHVSKYLLNISE